MTYALLESLTSSLGELSPFHIAGKILEIRGLCIKATVPLLSISIGYHCKIYKNDKKYIGEIIALTKECATLLLASTIQGLGVGDQVEYVQHPFRLAPDLSWKGRVLNAFGEHIDERGPLHPGTHWLSTKTSPLPPSKRSKIRERFDTGVRTLNAFTSVCKGQRLGIFAGSGVGKSVLLSMLTRFADCDVCIIGLIGERGRELKEFLEDTLGDAGLRKSIVVVATSDEPPLARRQAAYTTLTLAEYFREQGLNVLCIMDSLTRFAMAQREIGLSAGEPPTTKGYPPSVFFELAQLCERAGAGLEKSDGLHQGGGMMTAFFSVLVDGDDHNEPIADAARGILDGHIVLDRKIAERGLYPSINVLRSISRLSHVAQNKAQQELVTKFKRTLATFDDMADLIRMGAYQRGANFEVDLSIKIQQLMEEDFFKQLPEEYISFDETFSRLEEIWKR